MDRVSAAESEAAAAAAAVIDVGPAVVTTATPGPNVPVELVTAAAARAAALAGDATLSTVPIYVESPSGELASVVASSPSSAGLQLTTITVAVPAPLSPNDPAFLAAAAAANQTTPPPSVVASSGSLVTAAAPPPPTTVALPTVPAPQESTFKWKYEQNKEKSVSSSVANAASSSSGTGTSLVSESNRCQRKIPVERRSPKEIAIKKGNVLKLLLSLPLSPLFVRLPWQTFKRPR